MVTAKYTEEDRAKRIERYGSGPWVDEPDEHKWEMYSIACEMRRELESGHWCGYVLLPEGHPWFGWTSFGRVEQVDEAITHTGAEDGRWCIGFDCAHDGDLSPGTRKLIEAVMGAPSSIFRKAKYRDFADVKARVERLAAAALAASTKGKS